MYQLLKSVFEWASQPAVLSVLLGMSFLSLVASVVGVPWYLRRLPADYFSRREQAAIGVPRSDDPSRLLLVVLRNLLGATLVLAGVAMLVLPGQGLATVLVGLLMMDYPGKKRLQRHVLSLGPVLRAANALRHRAGQPPLIVSLHPPSTPLATPEPMKPPHSQPVR